MAQCLRVLGSRYETPCVDGAGRGDRRLRKQSSRRAGGCFRSAPPPPWDRREIRCSSHLAAGRRRRRHRNSRSARPYFGRLDPLAMAVQQAHTERMLQIRDRSRNAGLCGAETLRRFPHTASLQDSHQDVEVLQLHPASDAIAQLHGAHPLRNCDDVIRAITLYAYGHMHYPSGGREKCRDWKARAVGGPDHREDAMALPRRQFLHLAAGCAALPALSRMGWAQAYPTRPVRFIVGAAGGSSPDIFARLLGQWLSERLGQPFVIENRPGAGGNIAFEAVVRVPLGRLHACSWSPRRAAINAALYEKLSYQPHPRHRAGRGRRPRAPSAGGQPIGSGQDGPRVHRLRQGQPGQAQHGVGRHWDTRLIVAGELFKHDGRCRHGSRALSQRARPR